VVDYDSHLFSKEKKTIFLEVIIWSLTAPFVMRNWMNINKLYANTDASKAKAALHAEDIE